MNITKKSAAAVLLVVAILAGCEQETVRTVDWYKEHTVERQAKLEECRANPGEMRDTPNCINAMQAADEEWRGGHIEFDGPAKRF